MLPTLAIVDLETTGGDATHDRITEIAILRIEGGQLVDTWSSLIQPGIPIPPRIQAINGIDDAAVRDAPVFEALADQVRARLEGCIFVAHSARFDYNFLRAAFERMSQHFALPVLCTVKLSRALDPQHPRHGLDALIARHGYHIAARHRATDDALIVWRFMQDSMVHHPAEHWQRAWQRAYSDHSVPRLPAGDMEGLPDAPGVYVLFGSNDQVVEIGHSKNLRSHLLGLFTGKLDAKRQRQAKLVAHVDARPAAGSVHAALLDLQLRRQLTHAAPEQAWAWQWHDEPSHTGPLLTLVDLNDTDPATWKNYYGCFRGPREAQTALRQLAGRQSLCLKRLGLEHGEGACSARHIKRCHGACTGHEEPRQHDLRLMTLLAALKLRAWPTAGPLHLREAHDALERIHVFDQWCYLGSAANEDALAALQHAPRRFDAEIWRLLQRQLMPN